MPGVWYDNSKGWPLAAQTAAKTSLRGPETEERSMAFHLDDNELYFFNEGISTAAYEALGCHARTGAYGERVYRFAVWAPEALAVSVVGDFNAWNAAADPMHMVGTTGVWEAHLGFAREGQLYKYSILTKAGETVLRADPFAVRGEPGGTASMVAELPSFPWTDGKYLDSRRDATRKPMSIYEVHAGTWREGLDYRELAHELIDYVSDMGYTHIEFMPLMEYPYDKSWGYQVTGYFAATARYGAPEDLMYLVNRAHERGIGVIMDWVPAHFTRDAHGLRRFDGSLLYEHADPRRSDMPQWGTLLFNFERTQVQSFLLSSAMFWLNEYHFDGLRVDAVACMLYLDYAKNDGEWLPNQYGGRENLGAIEFFKKLSKAVHQLPCEKLLFAEDSTAYPYVTRSIQDGGLGFSFKWNMGWMNDLLTYMEMDSYFRKWNHDKLTFSLLYAFSEHYVLPFSHDEVVHGKKSMLGKMPGDYWQQFAQLRLLFAYQFAHPGKKLMFMGAEFGQYIEWRDDQELDWLLLDYPKHAEMQRLVRDLNRFYTATPPLYRVDDSWEGFTWLSVNDSLHSTLAWMRFDERGNAVLCAFNFTPVPQEGYVLGVPGAGSFTESLSTDEPRYGGTGDYKNGVVLTEDEPCDNFDYRIRIKLPPYGGVYFTYRKG